jgi:hypothetical protein
MNSFTAEIALQALTQRSSFGSNDAIVTRVVGRGPAINAMANKGFRDLFRTPGELSLQNVR